MANKDKLKYSKQGREEIKAAKGKGKGPQRGRAGKSGGAGSSSRPQQSTSYTTSTATGSGSKSSRPSKGPGSKLATSSSDQQQSKQRTGFRIGRKPAPGVYTGKADKIKASLIHNAKVKKQYAKMLQREGLGKGLSAGATAARATREDDDSMDVEDSLDDTHEGDSIMQEEEEAGPSRVRSKRPKRDPLAMQEDIVPPRPILSKRKSSEMERHPDDMLDDEDGAPPGPSSSISASASANPNHVHPDRRHDGKGKGRGRREEVEQQPPQKRQRLTEDEIEEKRNERKEKKRDWMKKGRTGQPMMGKRMDVLLGKIEKSVGKK